MKKIWIAILSLIMIFSISACSSRTEETADTESTTEISAEDQAVETQNVELDPNLEDYEMAEMSEGEAIFYQEESDNPVVEKVESKASAYLGSWKAISYRAVQLYGNVNLTINKDGTWTGNITDEDMSGTWKDNGDSLHLSSDTFNFDLAFDTEKNLVLIEEYEGETLYTVLVKD